MYHSVLGSSAIPSPDISPTRPNSSARFVRSSSSIRYQIRLPTSNVYTSCLEAGFHIQGLKTEISHTTNENHTSATDAPNLKFTIHTMHNLLEL